MSYEIVYVIKKLYIYLNYYSGYKKKSRYMAEIYDGSLRQRVFYGRSEDKVRKKAVKWIHKNYDIPDDISISSGFNDE